MSTIIVTGGAGFIGGNLALCIFFCIFRIFYDKTKLMVAGQQRAVCLLVSNVIRLYAGMSRTNAPNVPSLFVPEPKRCIIRQACRQGK